MKCPLFYNSRMAKEITRQLFHKNGCTIPAMIFFGIWYHRLGGNRRGKGRRAQLLSGKSTITIIITMMSNIFANKYLSVLIDKKILLNFLWKSQIIETLKIYTYYVSKLPDLFHSRNIMVPDLQKVKWFTQINLPQKLPEKSTYITTILHHTLYACDMFNILQVCMVPDNSYLPQCSTFCQPSHPSYCPSSALISHSGQLGS